MDVPLSEKGRDEAISSGKKLKDFKFDTIYVSHMMRAVQTLHYILIESNSNKTPIIYHEDENIHKREHHTGDPNKEIHIFMSVNLAERYYGDLQGLNKQKTREKVGDEQVHIWRRSYNVKPPGGESLEDTCNRTTPYYKKYILKDLKEGKTVLISAHGNSLRAITKHIEKISDEDIPNVEIPTGIPIVYSFDKKMNVLNKKQL
jgi:2,3-bisphosphoglycerate-dependent phosphoglycerate mutase